MARTARRTRMQPLLETPERAQHAAAIIDRNISTQIGAPRGRIIQNPIDRLAARNRISPRMHSAGLKLKDDFEVGMQGAREDSGEFYLGIRSTSNQGWVPAAQLDAIRSFRSALKALGPYVGAILVAFCCYDRDVVKIAGEQGRHRDKVMGSLEDGLKTLADHYGLTGRD